MVATEERTPRSYTQADYIDFSHTGPETLAGQYMRRFWHPIHRAQDLEPGRAKPVRVMLEDFTLYRGETGQPHLLAFRCAHRGTQLSTGWVEGDELRCFYHGWKYDASGQCVEQPAEPEPFCQKIKVKSYPVEEYLGLIFAYLGAGDPPALPRYPEFEVEADSLEVQHYVRDCNYFNHLDNLLDSAHVPFVHGSRWKHGRHNWRPEYMPKLNVHESEWGISSIVEWEGMSPHQDEVGMPNIFHLRRRFRTDEGRADTLRWVVPLDDEHHYDFALRLPPLDAKLADIYARTKGIGYSVTAARSSELTAAILRGELRIEDVEATEDGSVIANVQDSVAQAGQGSLWERQDEHLGRSDVGTILRRTIWERELRALVERRPLKQWTRPPSLYTKVRE